MKRNWFCADRSQQVWIIVAFLCYLLATWGAAYYFDFVTNAFAILPVMVAAWLCGMRTGTLMAGFTILLGIGFHFPESGEIFSTTNVGSLILFVLALVIGLLSDSKHRLESELRDRQEAEEELAVTEQWYRNIFDGVNDGVIVETPDGNVLDVNERACEIFGWKYEEFLTKTIEDMVPPEYYALLADSDQTMPATEIETVNMRADGTYFPASVSGRLHKIGDEKRLIIIVRDITEKYNIQNELKQNHQFLSHVIESLSNPFYVVNVSDYSIAIANSAARGMNAIDPSTTCYALTHRLDAPCMGADHVCPMAEVLRTKQAVRVEHVHYTDEGEVRNVEMYAHPIFDARGQIVQMIESSLDITEHKKILAEMEEAKNAAETAAKAKADFLANMSHEIRTPLNAIYGMTSLMLNTPLNEEQQDFIETIRGGGETLLHVINDILDFSKIEAGKLDLEESPFSVRECIEEALDLLTETAAEKGLELAYYVEETVPPVIVGDITRVRQILVNLLNNGIKFTEAGEIVVHVSSQPTDAEHFEIHFSVRDTGIGIQKDKMDRLFKSFSQIDSSTTRKYGGTGLGLAISSDLAKAMGGRMWAKSNEGLGSIFHFTILVSADPDAVPEIPAERRQALAGRSVLIVDDNAAIRTILAKELESWGMKPGTSDSGAKALRLLQHGRQFDVGIFDLSMPDMDGYSLLEQAAAIQAFPVIVLTSLNQPTPVDLKPQPAAFVNKPVKTLSLFNALSQIFDGTAALEKREKKAAPVFSKKMAAQHPLKILLVEDNAINQKVALKVLSRLGYQADLAANGLEALEALERQTYDVVLMDIQMPEMDGEEATKRIRERYAPERQPHIIAMTAHALEGDREKYLSRGMDDYVSKPISVEALIQSLKDVSPVDH